MTIDVNDSRVGLGVDVIDISRFRNVCKRTPSFIKKMFSEAEIKFCNKFKDPIPHLAVRFAAKEAAVKALEVGFNNGIGFRDIEVVNEASGKPYLQFRGEALECVQRKGIVDFPISLSHTNLDAICCALALTKQDLEISKKNKQTVDEVTSQFKMLKQELNNLL